MSTATHMLINGGDTEGLFHGAFMESGSPLPVGDGIARGDMHFASIVEQTGCANATEALECLRGVPYGVFQQAVDSTPGLASPEVRALLFSLQDASCESGCADETLNCVVFDLHIPSASRRDISP